MWKIFEIFYLFRISEISGYKGWKSEFCCYTAGIHINNNKVAYSFAEKFLQKFRRAPINVKVFVYNPLHNSG